MPTCKFTISRPLYFVALSALLCCLPVSGVLGEDDWWKKFQKEPVSEDEAKRLMGQYDSEVVDKVERADFRISGKVVDETGRPLSEVMMSVKASYPRFWEWKSETKDFGSKRIDEGTFHLNIRKVGTVYLQFEKEGYYQAKTNFDIPESMTQEDEVEEAERAGRKPVLKDIMVKADDVLVVLERQGNITHLQQFVGGLRYLPDGGGTVIDFDRPFQGDAPKQYMQKVTNLLDRVNLPRNCAYILPELDEKGDVILKDNRWKEEQMEERMYCLPQRLDLCLSDTNSGFVMSELGNDKKTMHKMKQAPATGYKQPLRFDAAALLNVLLGKGEAKYQSFYFKIGEKYGKGYFMPTAVRVKLGQLDRYYYPMGNDGIVGIGIWFFLQPDGSRNLETGSD